MWIWDRATGDRRRLAGIAARPFFGFAKPRWSPDGDRLMLVVVRDGMTVAEANALGRQSSAAPRRFPEADDGEASVWVRRHAPAAESAAEDSAAPEPDTGEGLASPVPGHDNDLAVVHLATGKIDRIVKNASVAGYSFSPDGTHVAFTVSKGFERDTQQPRYDLEVLDLESGHTTTVGENLRLGYGIEFSWSPDSRTVAWIPSGQMARRAAAEGQPERIMLADIEDGTVTGIADPEAPSFDPFDGENRPLWDDAGRFVYAIGDNQLWRAEVATGKLSRVAAVPGWGLRTLVYDWHSDTVWTTADGTRVWTIARADDGSASAINPELDRYALGEASLLHWRSLEGQELAGALLLPPGYQPGTRRPLVVWVYGGDMGSRYVNWFGFWGSLPSFNMHVLATRGYAVLFPDAPVREGRVARDLMDTVMPGVNAAVEAGYADPERLALMGQSYGSHNVLAMISQTRRFRAAVITSAVLHPDLFADYLAGDTPGTGYYEQGQGNMGGSIWEVPERYFENSPIFRFDEIDTPLLIGQGEKDGDLVASTAIYNALERLDKRVEARVYRGEGHVITQRPNVLDFWQRRLDFLAECLNLDVAGDGTVSAAAASN